MRTFKKWLVGLTMAISSQLAVAGPLCPNLFPNFIRDICWSCIFPIRIAGIELSFLPGAKNNSDFRSGPRSPICLCTRQLKIGLPLSFWEQSHFIDVHTEPGCMPVLGGLRIPMPWNKRQYGKIENDNQRHRAAFRHST
jgi:conjugal transfer pilus assembly protein TraU